MNGRARHGEAGVVLINVLVILSIAAVVVFIMLSSQEDALGRARIQSASAAAEALARGAESSAITALRRDMATAPDTDHYGEPWAQVGQTQADLALGRLSVGIRDAQSRLNLARLRTRAVSDVQSFLRIIAELGIDPALGARIAAEIAARPGLSSLSDLRGVSPATLAQIAPYMDFLPDDAPVNLNTVDPVVLRAVLNNRSAALRLEQRRAGAGFLTIDDLTRVGAVRPAGAGFTSQVFDVEIVAEVDDVVVRLLSRIERRQSFAGSRVVVTRRSFGIPLNAVPDIPAGF